MQFEPRSQKELSKYFDKKPKETENFPKLI